MLSHKNVIAQQPYPITTLLICMVLLSTYSPVNAMHQSLVHCTKATVGLATGGYLFYKGAAKYEELTTPDMPPAIEEWSRENLKKRGVRNADSVPLKINKAWVTQGGAIISADKKDVEKLESFIKDQKNNTIVPEYSSSLGHEGGHYHLWHAEKSIAIISVLAGIASTEWKLSNVLKNTRYIKFLPHSTTISAFMCTCVKLSGLWAGIICCCRYHETQADQFSYETALTREELLFNINDYSSRATNYEYALQYDLTRLRGNFMKKKVFYYISQAITKLDTDIYHNDQQYAIAHKKRAQLVRLAFFFSDWQHPYDADRAQIAQHYYDQWKE